MRFAHCVITWALRAAAVTLVIYTFIQMDLGMGEGMPDIKDMVMGTAIPFMGIVQVMYLSNVKMMKAQPDLASENRERTLGL